jgi:hypothetical protein
MLKRVNVVLAILVACALAARLLTPVLPMVITFGIEGLIGLMMLWWRHRKKGRRPASLSKLMQQDLELRQRREAIRTRATPFSEETGPSTAPQAPVKAAMPARRAVPVLRPLPRPPVATTVKPVAAPPEPANAPAVAPLQPATSQPAPRPQQRTQPRPALQSEQLYGRLRRPASPHRQLDRQVLSRPQQYANGLGVEQALY